MPRDLIGEVVAPRKTRVARAVPETASGAARRPRKARKRPDRAGASTDEEAVGAAPTEEATLKRTVKVDAKRKPSPQIATLLVTRDKRDPPDHFRLSGCNSLRDLPAARELEERRQPGVALSEIARKGGKEPVRVIEFMYAWSQTVHGLAAWLVGLRQQLPHLHLVIIDNTGYEIPWEMLSIPAGGTRPGTVYLGAAVPVTRWQVRTLAEQQGVYSDKPTRCKGGMVAYLNEKLGAIENEKRQLSRLRIGKGASRRPLRVNRHDDAARFQDFLSTGKKDYALVYVACHGTRATSIDSAALGSDKGGSQLILSTLNYQGVPLVRRSRCAVFLNACHSGSFFEDPVLQDELLRGFPDLFLREGAPGVIATVGEVNDAFAAEMAVALLRAAVAAQNAAVAAGEAAPAWDTAGLPTLLQRQRADVARHHTADQVDDRALVCAFMYVYYGNPRCTLEFAAEL